MRDFPSMTLPNARTLIAGAIAVYAAFTAGPISALAETEILIPEQTATADPTQTPPTLDAPSNAAADTTITTNIDPWEGFNRRTFAVNLFIDDTFLVPAAKGYRAATPPIARRGIRKFLANVRTPGIFVNDLLQGEFGRAGTTLSRFVINSTLGAGGFADPATSLGLEKHSEDLGQTLAVWGVPSGPYVVLPFLGPSTIRHGAGSLGQIALNPLVYVQTDAAEIARYTQAGVGGLSTREQFLDPIQDIRDNSLDYYSSLRSFYLQNREREIANDAADADGFGDFESFDEFDDFDDFEEDEAFSDDDF